MYKRDQSYYLAAVAAALAWGILYLLLVAPKYRGREAQQEEARKSVQAVEALCLAKPGLQPEPQAAAELKRRQNLLDRTVLAEVRKVEASPTLDSFVTSRAGEGGPEAYFDQKRREVRAALRQAGVKLIDKDEDLWLRGALTRLPEDRKQGSPVPLNLVRLFLLDRFRLVAKEADVREISDVNYLEGSYLPFGTDPLGVVPPAELKPYQLGQIPLVITLRVTERNVGVLLSGLQRPSGARRSYFCLRGLRARVVDAASGMMEVTVAVAGLFPRPQLDEQRIVFKEEEDTSRRYQKKGTTPDIY